MSAPAQRFSSMARSKRRSRIIDGEFNDAESRRYSASLRVRPYYDSPEHSQSHGCVERPYGEPTERLTRPEEDRGSEGRRAAAEAILALTSATVQRSSPHVRSLRRAVEGDPEKATRKVRPYAAGQLESHV